MRISVLSGFVTTVCCLGQAMTLNASKALINETESDPLASIGTTEPSTAFDPMGGLPYPSLYRWQHIILSSVFVTVIMVAIVVGNGLVVAAIAVDRSLKGLQNWFIASLAVSDLLVGLFVMPLSLANELTGYWHLGEIVCQLWLSTDVLLCTASILNLCLISLDRYWSVTRAIAYIRQRTKRRAALMISVVWVLSMVICLPPLFGWKRPQPTKFGYPLCVLSEEPGYVVYSALGSFYLPLVLMVLVYFKIYLAARQRARRNLNKRQKTKDRKEEEKEDEDGDREEEEEEDERSGVKQEIGLRPIPQANNIAPTTTKLDPGQRLTGGTWKRESGGLGRERGRRHSHDVDRSGRGLRRVDINGDCRFETTTMEESRHLDHRNDGSDDGPAAAVRSNRTLLLLDRLTETSTRQNNDDDDESRTLLPDESSQPESDCPSVEKTSGSRTSFEPHGRLLVSSSLSPPTPAPASLHPLPLTPRGTLGPDAAVVLARSRSERTHAPRGRPTVSSSLLRRHQHPGPEPFERRRQAPAAAAATDTERARRRIARAHERRAIVVLGIVMASFVGCWLPFFAIYPGTSLTGVDVPESVFAVTFWLGYCNSALNPIIYTIFNRDFRMAFLRIICGRNYGRKFG